MAGVDRTIAGRGCSERAWAKSPWLLSLPDASFDDLLEQCGRIVVLSPHPDDETLGCGGLIFDAQRRDMPVVVCSVTSGENCYPSHQVQSMGQRRDAELVVAMQSLGLPMSSVQSWRLPDGDLANRKAELRERLSSTLKEFDLLLSPWELDGHPDHEACGDVAAQAASAHGAKLLRYPVWGWHWSGSLDRKNGLPSARGVRYALDAPAKNAKDSAIKAFKSQVQPDLAGTAPVLTVETLSRFRRNFEVYLT